MIKVKKIFQNANLGNLFLKNLLIRSATWENLAKIDGSIDEKIYKIYDELAKGGVGAIITGFTSILMNDFYFGGMMRLSEDFLIPQYKKLTDIVHAENCKIISQLALGAFYKNSVEIPENNLSAVEIKYIIQNFISAAIRAEKSGFDGVQIHAAHFFFLSRFISPICNPNENRTEILIKILRGIKKKYKFSRDDKNKLQRFYGRRH